MPHKCTRKCQRNVYTILFRGRDFGHLLSALWTKRFSYFIKVKAICLTTIEWGKITSTFLFVSQFASFRLTKETLDSCYSLQLNVCLCDVRTLSKRCVCVLCKFRDNGTRIVSYLSFGQYLQNEGCTKGKEKLILINDLSLNAMLHCLSTKGLRQLFLAMNKCINKIDFIFYLCYTSVCGPFHFVSLSFCSSNAINGLKNDSVRRIDSLKIFQSNSVRCDKNVHFSIFS